MVQRKIKLLIVTLSFPTRQNPTAGIFILSQLRELKKYCDIKVLSPHAYVPKTRFLNPYHKFSDIKNKEYLEGMEIYRPKYLMFPKFAFLKKYLSLLLVIESFFSYNFSKKVADSIVMEWDPDIIHIHSSLGEGLIGARLKKKFGKPLVLTVHGEDITRHTKQIFSRKLTKFTIENSDTVICVSKFLQNEIIKMGIKNKAFHIIPMGGRDDIFKPRDLAKSRRELNLPLNKKVILFVGHLVQRKGVLYLIKAIASIIKKNKNIKCLIIGKGSEEEKLKKLVSELKLENYFLFLGQKINEELPDYMNACDILALPSLNEGLPVVLCEAMLSGKPVVATKVAGTPELVTKDVGFLVEPKNEEDLAEKIALALSKKWNLKKILKRGREFSTINSAKKVVKVYNNFLKL